MYCFVKITWWPFLKRVNTGKYLIKHDGTELSLKLSMGMVFQCWGSGSPKEGDYFSGSNRIPSLIMMMLAMEKLMNGWNLSWKQKMGIFPHFMAPHIWYMKQVMFGQWICARLRRWTNGGQPSKTIVTNMVARPLNHRKAINLNGDGAIKNPLKLCKSNKIRAKV